MHLYIERYIYTCINKCFAYQARTHTPPTFTLQLFLDSLFLRLLTFFNGEMNQEMNRVFLRIQIEAYFHCFGQEKLGRRDYLDYLKLLAKSGDNLVS